MPNFMSDKAYLEKLFVSGKISEEEYYDLGRDDGQVVAVAVDEVDRITTVCLTKDARTYSGEVLYSPEFKQLDERFLENEISLNRARELFLQKINSLERRGHEFEVTWFV